MAALQCDICGGKLMGRPGGIFECDSCGMQYDTAWAKEKIQEIKGTVKVEGTVEVTGTVQVDNTANLQNLLNRMQIAINDNQWQQATSFAENALNVNAQCFEAYLGKLLCNFQVKTLGALSELAADFEENLNYQNAVRFADSQHRQMLENGMYTAKTKLIQQNEQKEIQAHLAEQAAQDARARRIPLLAARRAEIEPARRLLRFYSGDPFVLTADGKIRPVIRGLVTHQFVQKVQQWENIRQFEIISDSVLILDRFGNVDFMIYDESDGLYSTKGITFKRKKLVTDHSAVDICVDFQAIYVLTEAGTLQCAKVYSSSGRGMKWNGLHWDDKVTYHGIKSIVSSRDGVFCECMDGTKKEVSLNGSKELDANDDCTLYNRSVHLDGTVIRTHYNVKADESWDHVIDLVSCANNGCYGLMLDGSVEGHHAHSLSKTNTKVWQNVATIMPGGITGKELYGITNDGHILTTAEKAKLLITDPLFESLETLKTTMFPDSSTQKRKAAWEAFEKETRINEQRKKLISTKTALQTELANLTGLFAGKRRKEIEARLAQIETELKELK